MHPNTQMCINIDKCHFVVTNMCADASVIGKGHLLGERKNPFKTGRAPTQYTEKMWTNMANVILMETL
jgi:hypothetical protein